MKWTKEETNKAIVLLKDGNDFKTISQKLNRTNKSVKLKLNNLGYKQSDYVFKEYYIEKNCEFCEYNFSSLISENRKFCTKSCSTKHNNSIRVSKIGLKMDLNNQIKRDYSNGVKNKECINCGKIVTNKYCSQSCQQAKQRKEIFRKIESGDVSLSNSQYKKYLINVHGEKCMKCGWCEINEYSNTIPIELEHVDGDSQNNKIDNLKLLCPNCHSLTPTYKALNKGNGRHKRMLRYHNGESY